MAREIEEALAAWRDAVRRLEAALAGHEDAIDSKGAIEAEAAHLRDRFHRLSTGEGSASRPEAAPGPVMQR